MHISIQLNLMIGVHTVITHGDAQGSRWQELSLNTFIWLTP